MDQRWFSNGSVDHTSAKQIFSKTMSTLALLVGLKMKWVGDSSKMWAVETSLGVLEEEIPPKG